MAILSVKSISFIGSGNSASHLAQVFHQSGIKINQVYSRSLKNAKDLANKISASPIDQLDDLNNHSDLYIIAVNDDVIEDIANKLKLIDKIVVHTSGAKTIGCLAKVSTNFGSFYPLQTFNKNQPVDFKNIPILIDGNSDATVQALEKLGKGISANVQQANDSKRLSLHTAAVFANNFTNYLCSKAEELSGKDFKLLLPLIQETFSRLQTNSPNQVQTGPAKRGDIQTIATHIDYLKSNHPGLVDIYQYLTQQIQKEYV